MRRHIVALTGSLISLLPEFLQRRVDLLHLVSVEVHDRAVVDPSDSAATSRRTKDEPVESFRVFLQICISGGDQLREQVSVSFEILVRSEENAHSS